MTPVQGPLTAAEQPFVGRWRVDMDAVANQVKLSGGGGDDERWELLMGTMVDLRADRTAVFVGSARGGVGMWHGENDRAVFDGDPALRAIGVLRGPSGGDGRPRLVVSGGLLGVPLVGMERGTPLDVGAAAGEWVIDADATAAAWSARLAEHVRVKRLAGEVDPSEPEASSEQIAAAARQMTDEVVEEQWRLRLDAPERGAGGGTGEALLETERPAQVRYVVRDDLVVVRVPEEPGRDVAVYLFALVEGRLEAVEGFPPVVFKRK